MHIKSPTNRTKKKCVEFATVSHHLKLITLMTTRADIHKTNTNIQDVSISLNTLIFFIHALNIVKSLEISRLKII